MASKSRRADASLIELLERDPARFGFFQAVRLLEWSSARAGRGGGSRDPVGGDGDPAQETVRFRAAVSLIHPTSEIVDLRPGKEGRPPEMSVSFMGLVGPMGVLPEHYTEQLIEAQRLKNTSFRDFLDLLSHRSIALFYRAWSRNQLPVAYERRQYRGAKGTQEAEDVIGRALGSLVGLATPGLESIEPAFGRDLALHHAGQLSNRRRSAAAVRAMAADLLGRPVEVLQFQGCWLAMDPDAQTRLPSLMEPLGQQCQLGTDAIIGVRAWDVQAGFTIRVGPLSLREFRDLMPDGAMMEKLSELVRFIVGPAQTFSVQPVLRQGEVPDSQLGDATGAGSRLGWDSWLGPRERLPGRVFPATQSRDDAKFAMIGAGRAPGSSPATANGRVAV